MKMLIRNFTMSFLMVAYGHTHENTDQGFYHKFSNGRTYS